MKHVFIINPNSGDNKKNHIEEKITDLCEEMKMDYKLYVTGGPGEAERVAKSLENDDTSIVYAVGGDGTLNEVLNGIAGSDHILSVIPTGTGNDFYRTLKTYKKEYICADVGKINNRYFINVACFGFDAEIADNLYNIRKWPFVSKKNRYTVSIIYTFFKYKFKKLQIKFGDYSKRGKFTVVTVCNGRYYGCGRKIAPHAFIDDSQFEIYIVDKTSKLRIPRLIMKLLKGEHENDSRVVRYTDGNLEVISEEPVVCNVDGERMYDDHFKIEIIRNAIMVHRNTDFIKALGIEE